MNVWLKSLVLFTITLMSLSSQASSDVHFVDSKSVSDTYAEQIFGILSDVSVSVKYQEEERLVWEERLEEDDETEEFQSKRVKNRPCSCSPEIIALLCADYTSKRIVPANNYRIPKTLRLWLSLEVFRL
jgi:hypothetical protein